MATRYPQNQGLLDISDRIRARTANPYAQGVTPSPTAQYASTVRQGGLLDNYGAQQNYGATGYMPRTTVGGRYGLLGSMPMRPSETGIYPGLGQQIADNAGGQFFGGAQVRSVGGRNQFVDGPPSDYDFRGPNASMIPPSGIQTPAYRAAVRAQNQRSPGLLSPGRNAAGLSPLEALQASRDAAVGDAMSGEPQTQRGLLTARAMGRSNARQGRLEARRAGPQPMGLLEQMAMRDPRNAVQLMEMQQKGLLAQQGLGLQRQQLGMQGQELGLKRELGLLEAANQKSRFGVEDQRYKAETTTANRKLALDYRAAAAQALQNKDIAGAREYMRLAKELDGGGATQTDAEIPLRTAQDAPSPEALADLPPDQVEAALEGLPTATQERIRSQLGRRGYWSRLFGDVNQPNQVPVAPLIPLPQNIAGTAPINAINRMFQAGVNTPELARPRKPKNLQEMLNAQGGTSAQQRARDSLKTKYGR